MQKKWMTDLSCNILPHGLNPEEGHLCFGKKNTEKYSLFEVNYMRIIETRAPTGAWEVKLKIMTDQRTARHTDGHEVS